MTTRAVLYARVSSDDKAKTGGQNLQGQIDLCRKYAQDRGYTVVAELAEDDRGASGASLDLPQLAEALQLARARQYEVFIVRELDRLSRDLAKQLIVEQELKRAGVVIEYVLYDFPDTPEGRLNKNLRAMLAEYEREKITQRMLRGRLRKIQDGEAINHGHPPFGYANAEENGRAVLVVNEDEARTVRLIFDWYTQGDGETGPMSMRAIAGRLSEMRIPTYNDLRKMTDCTEKTLKGYGQWERSSIGSILSNETYTGTWRYGRRGKDPERQIAVQVPQIIDPETWEAAQARKASNKQGAKRNRKHEYLLTGRLRCGKCGRAMIGSPNYSYSNGERLNLLLYYRCQAQNRRYPCELRGLSFRTEQVDAIAWAWVKGLLSDPQGIEKSLRDYQDQRETIARPLRDRLSVVQDLIDQTQSKLGRLLDLYLTGDFEKDTLQERKARFEQERDKLTEERARLEGQLQEQTFTEDRLQGIVEFAAGIRAGLEQAEHDLEKRRAILDALDVTGELDMIDGEKVLRLHCVVGETACIVSNNSATDGRNTPIRLSAQFVLSTPHAPHGSQTAHARALVSVDHPHHEKGPTAFVERFQGIPQETRAELAYSYTG